MSCFGCCSRVKGSKEELSRGVENDGDNMFGDHFEGVDPERRKIEASRQADHIVKLISEGDSFKKSDLEVIKPSPILISTDTKKKKKKASQTGSGR